MVGWQQWAGGSLQPPPFLAHSSHPALPSPPGSPAPWAGAGVVCSSLGTACPAIRYLLPMIQHGKPGHSPSPFKYQSRESICWPRCFQQESWPSLGMLLRQLCNPSFAPKPACRTSLELQRQVIDHLGGKMGWFRSIFHHW